VLKIKTRQAFEQLPQLLLTAMRRPRSVVVAKPDENVLEAGLLQKVTLAGEDGWGHPTQMDVYKVWLTR
jgi:pyruvate kinase